MNYKKLLIISVAVLMILTSLTALTTFTDNQNNTQTTEKTGITATTDNLVQGEVNTNGVLWIVSYNTPSEQEYPQPFQSFHANNLTLEIYSPLKATCQANISVLSFLPETVNKNGSTINTITDPEYLNQTYTIEPRQVLSLNLKIPQTPGKREVSITFDNNTVSYYITTYHNIVFPFHNPLEIIGIIGVIMLIFTAISLGITKIIIDKAKYFPPISQRIWIGLIFITLIIIYQVVYNYYYDLTGEDWTILFVPLFIFNFLEVLSVYPSKSENDLLIHIKDTKSNDLETGLYSIRTAPMTEDEKGKYPLQNQFGKEYIDDHSYIDFFKRLIGIQIPIIMEIEEQPDIIQNITNKKPREREIKQITNINFTEVYLPGYKDNNTKLKKIWKFKDRVSKEHPYTEAVLLDPLKPSPAIEKIEIPYKSRRGKDKIKKVKVLKSFLNGKHMKYAYDFLAQYISTSEAGFEIHRLSKENAITKAEMESKAYRFRQEIFKEIITGTQTKPEEKEERKKEDNNGDDKNE